MNREFEVFVEAQSDSAISFESETTLRSELRSTRRGPFVSLSRCGTSLWGVRLASEPNRSPRRCGEWCRVGGHAAANRPPDSD